MKKLNRLKMIGDYVRAMLLLLLMLVNIMARRSVPWVAFCRWIGNF
jgi:hypothetical protein